MFGSLRQALLVYFRIKGLSLPLLDGQFTFIVLLFQVHFWLVLQSALVENFILTLAGVQAIFVALVVVKLVHNAGAGIICSNSLVLNWDLVDCTLTDQLVVLTISDLSLFACLKLLPSLHFDHSCVSISVLSLELDFFKLLSKPLFLLSLFNLLLIDSFMCLEESLFSRCLLFHCKVFCVELFLLAPIILGSFPFLSALLNPSSVIH